MNPAAQFGMIEYGLRELFAPGSTFSSNVLIVLANKYPQVFAYLISTIN